MEHRKHNGFETSLMEITVRGDVGCGKSEVLEVIANALREFYRDGTDVKVAGETCTGAIDEARHTGQSARRHKTVFVLQEKTPTQE